MPPPGTGKPGFHAELSRRAGLDRLDERDWAELAATYHGMVSRLDNQLGRLLAPIDAVGAADRTVSCCFTDHGEHLGDYGLVEKWPSGLEPCLLRNPLVVAGSGVAEGAVHDGPVEMVDLVPTPCELAGTEVGLVQFGRSLVPVLADPARAHCWRTFAEVDFHLDEEPQNEQADFHSYRLKSELQHERPELVGRAVAVRTPEWTYLHRLYEPDELYDRHRDPREVTNLIGAPAVSDVASQLRSEVLDWLVVTSDVVPLARDPRIDPVLAEQILV